MDSQQTYIQGEFSDGWIRNTLLEMNRHQTHIDWERFDKLFGDTLNTLRELDRTIASIPKRMIEQSEHPFQIKVHPDKYIRLKPFIDIGNKYRGVGIVKDSLMPEGLMTISQK